MAFALPVFDMERLAKVKSPFQKTSFKDIFLGHHNIHIHDNWHDLYSYRFQIGFLDYFANIICLESINLLFRYKE